MEAKEKPNKNPQPLTQRVLECNNDDCNTIKQVFVCAYLGSVCKSVCDFLAKGSSAWNIYNETTNDEQGRLIVLHLFTHSFSWTISNTHSCNQIHNSVMFIWQVFKYLYSLRAFKSIFSKLSKYLQLKQTCPNYRMCTLYLCCLVNLSFFTVQLYVSNLIT